MDHLACFLPANLALGVAEGAVQGPKAALYAEVAANLTYTCWQMYARMPTGANPAHHSAASPLHPAGPAVLFTPCTAYLACSEGILLSSNAGMQACPPQTT